jgi:L-iditol 2-dehydrogenase
MNAQGGISMLQAVMTRPGTIEFRDIEIPEIQDDEVLMRTKRIGVCGSDIHVYHGLHPYTSYPVVQGHEVSGVIAAVGKDVEDFEVGDEITFTPQVTCGECYPCRHGMYHICEMLKVMGFQTGGAGQDYFVLPIWNVLKLPDGFTLDQGAFVEPVAVGVHAVRKAGDVAGKKVLVLGAGTIGNLVAQVAKALGAEAVMITDISDYKLEKAKASGIDCMVNVANEDLEEAIASHFGPDKADSILECVGVQATADQAVANARKGTTIVVVGVFGEKPKIDLGLVQDRELSLVGTLMYQKPDYVEAIDLIATGRIKLENLITHRFKFEQYQDAYQTIDEANGHYMKVMIELD